MNPKQAIESLIASGWTPQRIAAQLDIDTRKINKIRLGLDGNAWGLGQRIIEMARQQLDKAA